MENEIQIETINVYGNSCKGCKKFKKDVMISFTKEGDKNEHPVITDLFLTQEQAVYLYTKLGQNIQINKSNKSKTT